MVGLNIITEDEADNTFKKFSMLKDHDIRYIQPSQITQTKEEYDITKGVNYNERTNIYGRRNNR